MKRRILIIEDDRDIADLVELHLSDLGCEVTQAHDGIVGLEFALGEHFDLVILDLMLPGLEGLEVCRRIRAGVRYVPILMLTAKSTELDRVLGLEMGADDYLTKPFSIVELVARVKARFRYMDAVGAGEVEEDTHIRAGDLEIDLDKRRVIVRGERKEVTAKEFDLLVFFARHPGRVFKRSQLLDKVWGYSHYGYEHTVNSHINRLRAKIEDNPAQPRFILTVWGVGYRFFDPSEAKS